MGWRLVIGGISSRPNPIIISRRCYRHEDKSINSSRVFGEDPPDKITETLLPTTNDMEQRLDTPTLDRPARCSSTMPSQEPSQWLRVFWDERRQSREQLGIGAGCLNCGGGALTISSILGLTGSKAGWYASRGALSSALPFLQGNHSR